MSRKSLLFLDSWKIQLMSWQVILYHLFIFTIEFGEMLA